MLPGSWLKQACWHSPERFDYNTHLTMSSANPLEGSTSSAAARQPWSPPSENTTHSCIRYSHPAGRPRPEPVTEREAAPPSPELHSAAGSRYRAGSLAPSLALGKRRRSLSLFPSLIITSPFISPFVSISIFLFLLCWKKTNKKKVRGKRGEGRSWSPQLAEHNAARASSIGVALTWLNSSSRVSLVMSLIPNATLRSQRQEK